jgi:hypothetical protein
MSIFIMNKVIISIVIVLVFPRPYNANIRRLKMFARYKHFSLFLQSTSGKEKKFYNTDARDGIYKTYYDNLR